jgi:histidine ammonia-lyase
MSKISIDPSQPISINDIEKILSSTAFELSSNAKTKIENCQQFLQEKIKTSTAPIYGINTGFGALYNQSINDADLGKLQENLVMSHACGMGDEVPEHIVKLMLYLKVRGLSYGLSGIQLSTVQRLLDYLNNEIYPVVYQLGSLGASGDLAPLAHLCLPMLSKGEVNHQGKKISSEKINADFSFAPIHFKAKEGLALLNGTQFMSAYASYSLQTAKQLFETSLLISALSLDAFDGRPEPFDPKIQEARPHEGQIYVAAKMREYIQGSELISRTKKHVQDPYSFRCIPQVMGAAYDGLKHIEKIFTTEINSVTDNPTIFPDQGEIISGGNFHGQPLAINLDYLSIIASEIASISERRIYQLINGNRDLPNFLAADAGLNSGFMIAQYTAASIVSQNKQLAMPASVDTIDSSKGQEDHVSMGANAATKCYKIIQNLRSVLAIELFTAAQALEFRRPAKSSSPVETLIADLRKSVPFLKQDAYMHELMKKSELFIQSRFVKC